MSMAWLAMAPHGDLETTGCNFCEARCWDTGTLAARITFGVGVKEHPWQRREEVIGHDWPMRGDPGPV